MRGLEIGGGYARVCPEYDQMDARPLDGVKYVQSGTKLGGIPDNSYDRIYTKWILEHIGWREVEGTLREWLRAAPEVTVVVPNVTEIEELLRKYQEEDNYQGVSGFNHFNSTLFGDQDYPENFHGCYFRKEWLIELFKAAGAKEVEVIQDTHRELEVTAKR